MGLGDFIILIAFAVGYLIIFVYQKKKIGTLITQIKSQGETLKQTEKFMNIFNLDKVEKFVQISDKTVQMEKDEAIKKMKSEVKENFDYLLREYKGLLGVSIDLIFTLPYLPAIDKAISEMEETTTKGVILKGLKNFRKNLETQGIDKRGWVANFVMGLNLWGFMEEKKSHSSSPQK